MNTGHSDGTGGKQKHACPPNMSSRVSRSTGIKWRTFATMKRTEQKRPAMVRVSADADGGLYTCVARARMYVYIYIYVLHIYVQAPPMNYLLCAVAMSQGQQFYLSEGQLFCVSEGQCLKVNNSSPQHFQKLWRLQTWCVYIYT